MYIAQNRSVIRANALLNYYCTYRLHKKVDYFCIVQFPASEIVVFITVRPCITNNHDALHGSWETLFGSRWCSLRVCHVFN